MTIFDARHGCPLREEKLFYDTNIWIFLYSRPLGQGHSSYHQQKINIYSTFHSAAEQNNNKIFTSEKVLCEFFNRMVKIEHEIMFGFTDNRQFKLNRKKPEFRLIMDNIHDMCQDICDNSEYIEIETTKDMIMDNILSASTGEIDLTDLSIIQNCRDYDLKLVTDDGDFSGHDIDIITANDRTLRNHSRR